MALAPRNISPLARGDRRHQHLQGPHPRAAGGNDAPSTLGNFVELAQKGFTTAGSSTAMCPAFIQGGCPNTRARRSLEQAAGRARAWPSVHRTGNLAIDQGGGPPPTRTTPSRGRRAAMAGLHGSQPAGSQFGPCLGPQHNLDPAILRFGPEFHRGQGRHRPACAPAMSSSPSSSRTLRDSFAPPRRRADARSRPCSASPQPGAPGQALNAHR